LRHLGGILPKQKHRNKLKWRDQVRRRNGRFGDDQRPSRDQATGWNERTGRDQIPRRQELLQIVGHFAEHVTNPVQAPSMAAVAGSRSVSAEEAHKRRRSMLDAGATGIPGIPGITGIAGIAKATGPTRQTVYRIQADPAAAEAALAAWGM
jgi:hypothetical protein